MRLQKLTEVYKVTNTLVDSDYKHNKVQDPNQLSTGRAHKMRDYVKKFFAKAHHKLRDRQKDKERKKEKDEQASSTADTSLKETNADDVEISDPEPDPEDERTTPADTPPTRDSSPNELKRKLDEANGSPVAEDGSASPSKRIKSETLGGPPAPPPPPPPTEPPETGEDEMMVEAGVTGGEDGTDGFHSEALEADIQTLEDGLGDHSTKNAIKTESRHLEGGDANELLQLGGLKSPTQLATPPSWTSSENMAVKQQDAMKYEGMNPERLARLAAAEEGE